MKRDYATGKHDDVIFFRGVEVEKTPAYGMKTLFVAGLNDPSIIRQNIRDERHIFFGANHSFNPVSQKHSYDYYAEWEKMIESFLRNDFMCSLDIPLDAVVHLAEHKIIGNNNFIPQIRVPIPNVRQWNYNTMIKIDDVGFQQTNPGVWCHSLHDLMDRFAFTEWRDYGGDEVIETTNEKGQHGQD